MTTFQFERAQLGRLLVIGPFGYEKAVVRIVGEWLWWYRIEAIAWTRLAGREHYLWAGQRAWVPKSAIHVRRSDVRLPDRPAAVSGA